jgi:hypothetical protein
LVAVLAIAACSHPPKHDGNLRPPPPSDASVDDIDAEVAEAPAADATVAENFNWAKVRKRVEDERAARKGKPRSPPCGADDPNEKCTVWTRPLAARGRLISPWPATEKTSVVALDVGSDDGVTEYHWAAVVDENDRPITKYQHVENIRRSECTVRLELSGFIGASFAGGARVALIESPPPSERAASR